jgi:uncharacterized protein YbgA (DUF1722 family)
MVATTEKGKLVFLKKKVKASDIDKSGNSKGAKPTTIERKPKKVDDVSKAKTSKVDDTEKQTSDGTLTVAFGRFNPPTVGHGKLLSAAQKAAEGGDLKIYPSRTQDAKKNPLDPDMKISYMKKMFPKYEDNIINDPEMKSIFNVLTTANESGVKNINIIVGSDRQSEFENLATKYNGELYNFDNIRVISAGVRDADAEGVEGMSASKMRKAVVDDDFDSFRRGTPKDLDDGETTALFNAVRTGMGSKKKKVKEDYDLWEIAPRYDQKTLRENYVKKNIFNIGDLIENLNTGLVGRIIRRGTNYLICLTKEEYMFKSWIRDVMEYTEVKMDRRNRLPNKPNTLIGTGGYLKNAMAATKTQKIRNFINKYRKNK